MKLFYDKCGSLMIMESNKK